jgi:hypothetical protein
MVCAENIQWYSGKSADVPLAAKPGFLKGEGELVAASAIRC